MDEEHQRERIYALRARITRLTDGKRFCRKWMDVYANQERLQALLLAFQEREDLVGYAWGYALSEIGSATALQELGDPERSRDTIKRLLTRDRQHLTVKSFYTYYSDGKK